MDGWIYYFSNCGYVILLYYAIRLLCTHRQIWVGIKELLFTKPRLFLWTFDKCCLTQDTTQCWECHSRSIATAASLFMCSYDMWVWWGWLSGCMTAKSVLLNTVIVSKTSCVGPWHNQKLLKCVLFFFSGSSCYVEEIKLICVWWNIISAAALLG